MKLLTLIPIALTLALVTSVAPVSAASGSSAAVSGTNPSQACADNTFMVQYGPGPDEVFPLEIASHGGCVSTVASRGTVVQMGDYSQSAYVAQCKLLKGTLPAELWNAPVQIVQTPEGPSNIGGFGGRIETCTWLLKGYHT